VLIVSYATVLSGFTNAVPVRVNARQIKKVALEKKVAPERKSRVRKKKSRQVIKSRAKEKKVFAKSKK